MKIINIVLDIILTLMVLGIIAGAAFISWGAGVKDRMSLTDKAGYYYATEIQGESNLEYVIGMFIDDVTDLFD